MKKIRILLIALLLILGGTVFSQVKAEEVKAQQERPFTPAVYKYKAGLNDDYLNYTLVKIFYNGDTTFSRPIYCLRGNVGFGGIDVDYTNALNYKFIGEMHTDAATVLSNYKFSTLNRTETINGKTVNIYNAILWVLDESYLPISKENYNEAEYKTELLNKAGIPESEHSKITKDDIEVIQQLAIWYFTNYDEQASNTKSVSQPYSIYRSQYITINESNDTFRDRADYLDRLFYYFIDGAINNHGRYGTTHTYTPKSYEFGDVMSSDNTEEELTIEQQSILIGDGDPHTSYIQKYYYVGPFTVDLKQEDGINSRGTNETIDASRILFYLQDSSNAEKWNLISKYKILKDIDSIRGDMDLQRIYGFVEADGISDISALNSAPYVNQLKIGSKYYIRVDGIVEDEQVEKINTNSKIKLEITSTYNLATANYLVDETDPNNQQPLVEINKEKKSESDVITNEPKKEFDLSLRKFITAINHRGQVTNITNRVPQVNVETLINGIENRNGQIEYTATYTHSKEPITVETGDIVTYTIRVYNEGEGAATATQVTDYLPEGLELVPASESTINTRYGWENPSGDKTTIVTNYLANKTIDAFDKTAGVNGLKYEDIQVECKVVATVTQDNQTFRNIAAITEDNCEDRDSNPGDPGRTDYNPTSNNSTYKEDDDDYEDLKMEGKRIDLSLRKFISKVERPDSETGALETVTIDSREPQVEIAGLKAGTSETARYIHTKDILTLKRGDIVTYTIRVYNEGNIDAYATQIKDHLPEELELVEGQNDIWTVEGNILTTDALKDKIIPAYDKTKQDSTIPSGMENLKWEKAKDDVTGLYYYDLTVVCRIKSDIEDGKVIKNVAEIAADKSNPEGLSDRDSQVNNVYEDGNHQEKTEQNGYIPGEQDDDDFEKVTVDSGFDLSLRKYITAINGQNLTGQDSRVPSIDVNPLKQLETTADYKHRKDPVAVKTGDIVTYTIRVYNEGEMNGTVTEVKDILPKGVEFDATGLMAVESQNEGIKMWQKTETVENWQYTYTYTFNETTRELKITSLSHELNNEESSNNSIFNLKASNFEHQNEETSLKANVGNTGWIQGLNYGEIQVNCKVVAEVTDKDQVLTNVATMIYNAENAQTVKDRDSNKTGIEFTEPTEEELVSETEKPYKGNTANKDELNDSNYHYEGQQDDDDFEKIVIKGKAFDLSLRKYIISVNGQNLTGEASRVPNIDATPLEQLKTTADYKHKKDPVEVQIGDIVTYRFSVYNEGEIAGEVYSIVDYLPQGLEFDVRSNESFIEYKETYTEEELIGKEYAYKIEGNKITITSINNSVLFELDPFNGENLTNTNNIDIKFKVTALESNKDQVLTNVATMTYAAKGTTQADRDSNKTGIEFTEPTQEELVSETERPYKGNTENKDELNDSNYHYAGQQDDDDFEKIVIKGKKFDLSLRKFITSIKRNGQEVELEDRTPKIDTTTLINGTFERNGETENTATYEHSKEPVVVKKGDIVTFTIRVYNEGQRDGYAEQITENIPEGLALILGYKENVWWEGIDSNVEAISLIGENGIYKTEEEATNFKLDDFTGVNSLKEVQLIPGKVNFVNSKLSSRDEDNLIKAFDSSLTSQTAGEGWQKADQGEGGLYYKDVEISCLVVADNSSKETITNVAEISIDKDKNKQDVEDDDSIPNNVANKNEDDNDFEPIVLKYFDLALRKFITGVETNGEMKEITTRIPVPRIGEDGNIVYDHTKEPVHVANNDIVTYTIRVYNEGTVAGYAEEITDDIPNGLEFLPEHDTNKQYEWIMIDKDGNKTDDVEQAVKITTEFLSKEKEEKNNMIVHDPETGEIIKQPTEIIDNKINSLDISKEPLSIDYKDVKVAFKVVEPESKDEEDRIIVNSAQISQDSDDDEDSEPGKWNEGEDDQDREKVYVDKFDLSLLKWVTETIVTVDGKTTTTATGFEPNTGKTETTDIRDNETPEPVAKVEIDKKKINKTDVKFVYKIRVTNEGQIAGYASEVTDYIPEGLEFIAEDNQAFGWVKDGDDKVVTRALETVLLKPGETAELSIIFTWKNDSKNLGLKTNVAEISEDNNAHNAKDIDSTTDNKIEPYEKEQEDDDDYALVLLSIKTGKETSYTLFIISMLTLLAGGMYLIKKYVLEA